MYRSRDVATSRSRRSNQAYISIIISKLIPQNFSFEKSKTVFRIRKIKISFARFAISQFQNSFDEFSTSQFRKVLIFQNAFFFTNFLPSKSQATFVMPSIPFESKAAINGRAIITLSAPKKSAVCTSCFVRTPPSTQISSQ